MHSEGFLLSVYDTCVYLKKAFDEPFELIILVMYVDDMLIATTKRSNVDKLKSQLRSTLNIKYPCPIKKILEIEIFRYQKARKLWLSQEKYANKMFAKFNMAETKHVNSPLAIHFLLSAMQCTKDAVEKDLMSSIY